MPKLEYTPMPILNEEATPIAPIETDLLIKNAQKHSTYIKTNIIDLQNLKRELSLTFPYID